jgi:uncharacterized protein Veg
MIKLTAQDRKLIEKHKKKVYKLYPGSFLVQLDKENFTIRQERDDLSILDVLSELCLLPAETPVKAWERAALTTKTTQNFNRTHPLRIEGMQMAEKIARVEARRMKSEIGRESRKFQD